VELEVFIEALPTVFILWSLSIDASISHVPLPASYTLAMFTSVLAVNVGICRSVVRGICRPDANKCVLVLWSLSTVVMLFINFCFWHLVVSTYMWEQVPDMDERDRARFVCRIVIIHLPQLLIAFLPLSPSVIISHPSLVALPLFTAFTFRFYRSSQKKLRLFIRSSTEAIEEEHSITERTCEEPHIRFSAGFTAVNIIVKLICLGFNTEALIVRGYKLSEGVFYVCVIVVVGELLGLWFTAYLVYDETCGYQLVKWIVYMPSDFHNEYIIESIGSINSLVELTAIIESKQLEWAVSESLPTVSSS